MGRRESVRKHRDGRNNRQFETAGSGGEIDHSEEGGSGASNTRTARVLLSSNGGFQRAREHKRRSLNSRNRASHRFTVGGSYGLRNVRDSEDSHSKVFNQIQESHFTRTKPAVENKSKCGDAFSHAVCHSRVHKGFLHSVVPWDLDLEYSYRGMYRRKAIWCTDGALGLGIDQ